MEDIKKDTEEIKKDDITKKVEPKKEVKSTFKSNFKTRKLDAINSMADAYKAKKAYDRIMSIGKGNK